MRNSRKSRIGLRWRRACRVYSSAAPSPTSTISNQTSGDPTPRAAVSRPNVRQHSATPDSTIPNTSSGPTSGSRISSMKRVVSTMPSRPIGTLMRKIQRQDRYVTRKPAQRRPQHRPDGGRDQQPRHRRHQIGLGHRAQQHQPSHRHHHRPADPLQDPRRHQERQPVRLPAQDRTQREQPDRATEHRARPVPVRQPPAGRDEHSKAEQIAGQCHVHMQRAGTERAGHGRQCSGQHRAVQLFHKQRGGDDHGGDAVIADRGGIIKHGLTGHAGTIRP